MRRKWLVTLGVLLSMNAAVVGARAADFTITKDIGAGTFTFTDLNATTPVSEIVVDGLGTYAGTTRPGFTASTILFGSDPGNCLPVLSSSITSGFCYKLTNPTAGTPITTGTTVFTYDSSFDTSDPSDFAVAFNLPNGLVGAYFGTTGSNVSVQEPESSVMILATLMLIFGLCRAQSLLRHRPGVRMTSVAGRVAAGLLLAGIVTLASPASARLTRILVDTTGTVAIGGTNYTLQVGRLFGDLDPADPHNAVIQDIGLAGLDASRKVPYAATFTILAPQTGATGVMLYQVSNRGGQGLPNAATVEPGATYVWTGWQGDLLARNCVTDYPCNDLYAGAYAPTGGSPTHVLQVPVAHNTDGSQITGPVYGSVLNTSGSTAQLIIYTTPVPYRPATLNTTAATLWSVTHQAIDGAETGQTVIPSDQWAWADCRTTPFPGIPDPTRLCLKSGFDSNLLYQIVFTARDPLPLGIGFAATRDAVSFMRDAGTDDYGNANPLKGKVNKTIAMGTSQSGNFLRSMTYFGFNQTETNGQVFDAIWPHIAGRQIWLNTRFALPDVIQMLYMAADEAPVWWDDYADTARGRAPDGLLHACTVTGTCPKVVETYGALEFWDLKNSADRVGATATTDIPLPTNVYSYYFPGTSHGGGAASAFGGSGTANPGTTVFPTTLPNAPAGCALPANPNPEADQFNATLDNIVAWVVNGVQPPPSVYPRLSLGQLVPDTQGAMNFPTIPGFPLPPNLVNPLLGYNFGPLFNTPTQTGIITIQPPRIVASYPTYVVKTNTDGNEVAGIPSVNHQAALGTYTGWNTWAKGGRQGEICNLNGSYHPFATTRAARLASGDPRFSLEERYGTHAGFVCVVKLAAKSALSQRFLRQSAASSLVAAAYSSTVLTDVPATSADITRANYYCAAAANTGL